MSGARTVFGRSLERSGDGTVDREEWHRYLKEEHARRGEKKATKGDQWFKSLMRSLRRGCGMELEEETEEEQARDGLLDRQIAECEEVYTLVAGLLEDDGRLHKEELVKAHGGDYRVFEKMDTDHDNTVSLDEWKAWIVAKHRAKAGGPDAAEPAWRKADSWLSSLLFTLKRGCGVVDLTQEQIEESHRVYRLIAEMVDKDGVLQKDELVKAHGGDYQIFQSLDADQSGAVSSSEWILWLRTTHAAQPGVKEGDEWLRNFLFTLERGAGLRGLNAAQCLEAEHVYELVASTMAPSDRPPAPLVDEDGMLREDWSLDGAGEATVTKEMLIKAHGGSPKLKIFENCEADRSGAVSLQA